MTQEFDFHASIKRLADARAFESLRALCRVRVRPLLVLSASAELEEAERKHQEEFHITRCACQGRRWIPEPDVEKARMRVIAALQSLCGITLTLYLHGEARIDFHRGQPRPSIGGSLDTVPFRAAEAWLEEKP